MRVSVAYPFRPQQITSQAAVVMDHFGVSREQGEHVIARDLQLEVAPGQLVCFTGPSGSGKSSLLRAVAAQLTGAIDLDMLSLPECLLVDALALPVPEALSLLAACGLGEARLLLRTPAELSEGQRYRFRLAYGMSLRPAWVLADEFTATLDRPLAQVIASNLHRLVPRLGIGCLIATSHTDVVADLDPDLHVQCSLDGPPVVKTRDLASTSETETGNVKKNDRSSGASCVLPPARKPTGRTLRAGITAGTPSGWCGRSPCCGTAKNPLASASSPPLRCPSIGDTWPSD